MENLFGFHCTAGYSEQSPMAPSLQTTDLHDDGFSPHHMVPLNWNSACGPEQFASSGFSSSAAISDAPSSAVAEVQRAEAGLEEEEEVSKQLRAKIACHPLYPQLLEAYIDCQKVGAPPEIAKLLDEIGRENGDLCQRSACLGADPELDEFMVSFLENSQFFRVQQFQTLILTETYRDLLVKYKSDLSKPFDEATAFLNNMEAQLNSICSGSYRNYSPGLSLFSLLSLI
ncbi:homeobox protein knotted-1-like 6 [Senna tora]|uniref:Homeobox protein knotted-1-like 6 n=1 Tax=Senna tora TaxID=362788 RepID=A0A834X5A5_9FABA|nr:homeobox protein knotted-1-like 6 [Senna tora]